MRTELRLFVVTCQWAFLHSLWEVGRHADRTPPLCSHLSVKVLALTVGGIFVCLFVSFTGYSLLRAPRREWIFACTTIFTPASRAAVLRLRGGLTCVLRICLYRREAMEGEERGKECQF